MSMDVQNKTIWASQQGCGHQRVVTQGSHRPADRSAACSLPDTVWQDIFAFGTATDLAACTRVSRRWRTLGQYKATSRACLQNSLSSQSKKDIAEQTSKDALAAWVRAEACLEQTSLAGPMHLTHSHPGNEDDLPTLLLSPKERWLGVRSDCQAGSWALHHLQDLCVPPLRMGPPHRKVFKLIFSPNERLVATLADDPIVHQYRLPSGRAHTTLSSHTTQVLAGAYSADSKLFASVSKVDWQTTRIHLHTVTRWNLAPRTFGVGQICVSHDAELAFLPDLSALVLYGHYGAAIFDLTAPNDGMAPKIFGRSNTYINRALWTGSRLKAVVRGDDESIRYTDGIHHRLLDSDYGDVSLVSDDTWDTSAYVSEDINWAVKGGHHNDDGNFYPTLLFDLTGGPTNDEELETIELHDTSRGWQDALFSPAAHRLLLVNDAYRDPDGPAFHVHDLRSPVERQHAVGASCGIDEAIMTNDGRRAFTRLHTGDVFLWHLDPQHTP